MNQITPEEKQEYEEQLDQLTEKELLLQVVVELQTIRYHLTPEQETPTQYRCNQCNDIVAKEDRSKHLQEQHGAPKQMPVGEEFQPVQ